MKRTLLQMLVIAAIALVPAIASALWHPNRPPFTAPQLQAWEVSLLTAKHWGDAVIWVDARSRPKYERGHIPGALLLNEDEWDTLLPQVLLKWQPGKRIVLYCDSRQCHGSHFVAERLRRESQLKDVFVLANGWQAWVEDQQK